jgi:hypothetical protein
MNLPVGYIAHQHYLIYITTNVQVMERVAELQ